MINIQNEKNHANGRGGGRSSGLELEGSMVIYGI